MDYEKLSKEELIAALKESQEISKGLLQLMEYHSIKMSEISIKSLEEQIKLKHKFLADLEDGKPPRIFKSIRKEWQEKIDSVKTEIEELDKKLFNEYTELGESLQNLSKKNEDND